MNQQGLLLDLKRMLDDSLRFSLYGDGSWIDAQVYTTQTNHRMHTVCSTLEALGYVKRRFDLEPAGGGSYSRWSFTEAGAELLSDLQREARLARHRS